MQEEHIAREVVDAALKVHTKLGPGLLESAYEACLVYELSRRGLRTRQQVAMPVVYEDVTLDIGYRLDVLVNDSVVLELKSIEKVLPIHRAQLLSYLRLTGYRVGLLLNFHTVHMRDGVKRVVNGYSESSP
jgi:GxxExxY protein